MSSAETFQIESNEGKRAGLFVILAGLITTTITLTVLFYLNQTEFQAMGFYVNRIIPAGAILVGLIAGSGYGIASYWLGAKIGKGLLAMVILLQVAAYFGAQYFEYTEVMKGVPEQMQMPFARYYDLVTRAFAFAGRNGKPGDPFGAWGYAMRVLEVAGFAGGGLIAPAVLFSVPYCDKCQVYMKSEEIGLIPAGIKPRKVKKKDEAGQAQLQLELKEAMDRGLNLLDGLQQAVEANQPLEFHRQLYEQPTDKKQVNSLTSRFALTLQRCRRCGGGNIVVNLVTGQGQEISREVATTWEVDPSFVQGIMHPAPPPTADGSNQPSV